MEVNKSNCWLALLFLVLLNLIEINAFSSPGERMENTTAIGDVEVKATKYSPVQCVNTEVFIEFVLINHSNETWYEFPLQIDVDANSYVQRYYSNVQPGDSVVGKLYNQPVTTSTANDVNISVRLDTADSDITNNEINLRYEFKAMPKVDFKVDDVCAGQPSLFINRTQYTDSLPMTYTWIFGDGSWSPDTNPSYTYHVNNYATIFSVALTVVAGPCIGRRDSTTRIWANPDASFSADIFDRELLISSVATTDPTFTYFWELGDGTVSGDQLPTHTYPDSNGYEVCHTVVSNQNCRSKFCDLGGPSAQIVGRIYVDGNDNCQYDLGEEKLLNEIGRISNVNIAYSTDEFGRFSVPVPAGGDYVFKVPAPSALKASCASDSLVIKKAKADSTYLHDFIFELDSSVNDIQVYTSARLVKGRGGYISVYIRSNGVGKEDSIDVQLSIPDFLTADPSSTPYKVISPGVVLVRVKRPELFKWSRSSLNVLDPDVKLITGQNVQLIARSPFNDNVLTNNVDTAYVTVRAPHDPNDKSSYPDGAITERPQYVDYTIRFQNIGSAEAQDVVVYDVLDHHLLASDIQITGSSHPDAVSMSIRKNMVKWTFKNINLPDSASDPEGSQGFISYRVAVSPSFGAVGDTISNQAAIYFDFEDAIYTNTTKLFIVDESASVGAVTKRGSTIKVWPNPSTGKLILENQSSTRKTIMLVGVNGKHVRSFVLNAGSRQEENISEVKPGIYFLEDMNGEVIRLVKL